MERGLVDKSTLVAIGDAIRGKNGETTTYLPSEMAPAIINLPTGGGNEPTDEELTFTGDCTQLFSGGKWNWLIKRYGNRITTKNITEMPYMFQQVNDAMNPEYKLDGIPFMINGTSDPIDCTQAFYNAHLEIFPNIKVYPRDMQNMFSANSFTHLPENYAEMVDCRYLNEIPIYEGHQNGIISTCQWLREAPYEWYKYGNPKNQGYWSCYFTNAFYGCYTLDEAINLPNPYYEAEWTRSVFAGAFGHCKHLKDLTFAPTMTNGQPNNPKWSNQEIILSDNVGYFEEHERGNGYGLPAEKGMEDDATYQQFKNDKDAWTRKIEYSRYNHDSAVRTINSLPDTSAYLATNGGTNIIKFKGDSGSKTDGGAINTLTEQEIAVAAAKGWTVSLV